MAWALTIDESSLTRADGAYEDAPFSLATSFRLAPGAGRQASGLLTTADNDVYSLGGLPAGSYAFTVTLGTWYSGGGFGGTLLPTLRLYNSAGVSVAQSSAAGTLTHLVDADAQGAFFLGVLGRPCEIHPTAQTTSV